MPRTLALLTLLVGFSVASTCAKADKFDEWQPVVKQLWAAQELGRTSSDLPKVREEFETAIRNLEAYEKAYPRPTDDGIPGLLTLLKRKLQIISWEEESATKSDAIHGSKDLEAHLQSLFQKAEVAKAEGHYANLTLASLKFEECANYWSTLQYMRTDLPADVIKNRLQECIQERQKVEGLRIKYFSGLSV